MSVLKIAFWIFLVLTPLAKAEGPMGSIAPISDAARVSNDRRNNLGASANQAGGGAGAHAAKGAAMIAQGMAMQASIIESVRIAGKILVAKGLMEMAQSSADSGVQKDNNGGRDRLSLDYDGSKGSNSAAKNAPALSLPPELEQQIRDQGVNPDEFLRQLTQGELDSPEAVARAGGFLDGVSSEKVAQALASTPSEIPKADGAQAQILGYAEDMGLASRTRSVASGAVGNESKDEVGKPATSGLVTAVNRSPASKGAIESHDASPEGHAASIDDMLSKMLNKEALPVTAQNSAILREVLLGQGVDLSKSRMHIFQMAQRNYRGWGQWRKSRSPFVRSN